MKKIISFCLIIGLSLTYFSGNLFSWGFFAHKRINRVAVFTLPKEMFGFYKSYIDYITEHSVDADKRRHSSKGEAPRHYIDIDHYGNDALNMVPHRWDSAISLLTEDTLNAYGIVPWHVNRMYYWLVDAFEKGDVDRILKVSADMGHYIADAHVPLHTTENYNGQLSGQKGIHAFWESRLPELFGDQYDYFLPKAKYIDRPLERIWLAVEESHLALDSVLSFEEELTARFSEDTKFAYEERGASLVRAYSRDFSKAYHDMLNGMVERRMRRAMECIGSFWYSAWIEAGQPDLNRLINPDVKARHLKEIDEERKSWKRGKWIGRPEE